MKGQGINLKKKELSTTQIILLGFLFAIVIGTVLLSLPISSASGQATPLIDALFTATTSVCVIGLVAVDTHLHWSFFGQAVILILIQIGGIGVVSITTGAMLLMGQKVTLKHQLLIGNAFNLDTLSDLVSFLKKIFKGTFIVEIIGAICYAFVFVPQFGWKKGIWYSVFNGVSAFCNSGMDILGADSLTQYISNPWINVVTMVLAVLGGLGFVVWWDVIKVICMAKKKEIPKRWIFRRCTLHTKIVLSTTIALIAGGAICVFLFEYSNPATLGNLSTGDKIMAALFQSVTTRTAGFYTISQKGLRDTTALVSMILMFIGGSPSGTAGGVKTTTVVILIVAAISMIKGQEEVVLFNRAIPVKTIRKALAEALLSFFVCLAGALAILIVTQGSLTDVMFEMIGIVGTTGLTRGLTGTLDAVGKLIIIVCMYLGRVGPISLAVALQTKKKNGLVNFPEDEVAVG